MIYERLPSMVVHELQDELAVLSIGLISYDVIFNSLRRGYVGLCIVNAPDNRIFKF